MMLCARLYVAGHKVWVAGWTPVPASEWARIGFEYLWVKPEFFERT